MVNYSFLQLKMLGYASLTRVIRRYKVLLYLLYNEERVAKLCFDADCFS